MAPPAADGARASGNESFARVAAEVNGVQRGAATARRLPVEWLLPGDNMQVLLNTDANVTMSGDLSARVEAEVAAAIERFGERITRVEVHLADENAGKGGAADKRCMVEARVAGRAPVAVSAQAASYELAFTAATEKLEKALDHQLGRLEARQGSSSNRAGEVSG